MTFAPHDGRYSLIVDVGATECEKTALWRVGLKFTEPISVDLVGLEFRPPFRVH